MTHFTFDSHWEEIKGVLKQRYGQLTDDDLAFVEGKADELLGRLREKLGMAEGDLDALLDSLYTEAAGRFGQVKAKVGEFAGEARARAGAVAEDLKARAAVLGEEARAQAGVAYDQAREKAGAWRTECEEYIRQKPRETLLGALCAGFVVGLMLRD